MKQLNKVGWGLKEDIKINPIKAIIQKIVVSKDLCLFRKYPIPMFRILLDKKDLVGVYIGVVEGTDALKVFTYNSIKKMYLIDDYNFDPSGYKNPLCVSNYDMSKSETYAQFKDMAIEKLGRYKDKSVYLYKDTSEALRDIEEELDFVAVKGLGTSGKVRKDICEYWEKLKVGGIIGGYNWERPEVSKVITDIFKVENINAFEGTWWVIKDGD